MWDIFIVHVYSKLSESLINKLFFRSRFIGKRIRLILHRVLINIRYIILSVCILFGIIYFFSKTNHSVSFLIFKQPIILAIMSAILGYLISFLPKGKKINAKLNKFQKSETDSHGNRQQQYFLGISNNTNMPIFIEKLFLVSGDFVKNYDVIYVNTDTIPTNNMGRDGYDGNIFITTQVKQAVISPVNFTAVKFYSHFYFKKVYIQDTNLHLYPVNVDFSLSTYEFEKRHRGVFATTKEQIDNLEDMNWIDKK